MHRCCGRHNIAPIRVLSCLRNGVLTTKTFSLKMKVYILYPAYRGDWQIKRKEECLPIAVTKNAYWLVNTDYSVFTEDYYIAYEYDLDMPLGTQKPKEYYLEFDGMSKVLKPLSQL